MRSKNVRLSSLDCRYDYESGTIELTTKDTQLRGQPFKISLSSQTESYHTLYDLMDSKGAIDHNAVVPKQRVTQDLSLLTVHEKDPRSNFHLGQGVGGSPYAVDLLRTTHSLIAGGTASGKSVLLRNVILHALTNPQSIELYGVDFNKVELWDYFRNHPSRLATNLESVHRLLEALVSSMNDRYQRLDSLGIKHAIDTDLPWIYLVIDDLYPLFATPASHRESELQKECLALYESILKRGRLVGISIFTALHNVNPLNQALLAQMTLRVFVGNALPTTIKQIVGDIGPRLGLLKQRGTAVSNVFGETQVFSPFFFPMEVALELQQLDAQGGA